MVVTLQAGKDGKATGPAMILHDGPIPDDFKGAKLQHEANGGITMTVEDTDEFGNELTVKIHLDGFDLHTLKNFL